KRLAAGSVPLPDGTVKYKVDLKRIDEFFSALSCGILYKTCKTSLPENYRIGHIYHNFVGQTDPIIQAMETEIEKFYSGKPMDSCPSESRALRTIGFTLSLSSEYRAINP